MARFDPSATEVEGLRELLVPAAPGRLAAYPVSTEVNSVKNNVPHVIEPPPPDDEGAAVLF